MCASFMQHSSQNAVCQWGVRDGNLAESTRPLEGGSCGKNKMVGVFQPTPDDLCVHAHKPMNEKMVDHRLLKPSLALFRWKGPIILEVCNKLNKVQK